MRVLIVFNHPAPYKVDLFNELSKHIDLDVFFERAKAKDRPLSFYKNDSFDFNLIKNDSLSINVGKENCLSFGLEKYIKSKHKSYDLIIMNGYSTLTEMITINYLKREKIPYAMMINGGIKNTKECFIKRKIKTHFINGANYYLSPGVAADDYLLYYGAKESNIHHYPYSTLKDKDILSKFYTSADIEAKRNELKLPHGKLYVCPNQFIKRKNNGSLIKQFEGREEKLLLIGSGSQKQKYVKYVNKRDLKNIIIWDFIPKYKLMDVLPCCDGLISFSKKDIYGHSILEGMACGLPVISSKNIISAQEIIKNNVNGFILNNDDELFDCINRLNEDMKLRAIVTAEKYTIEKTCSTLLDFFNEVAK